MKVQSSFYPDFICKTVDILPISSFITEKMPKLLIFDAFTLLICEKKLSQITHFCGVKLLAWKSGCVNFLTNSMSGLPQVDYGLHNFLLQAVSFPCKVDGLTPGQQIIWRWRKWSQSQSKTKRIGQCIIPGSYILYHICVLGWTVQKHWKQN